MTETRNAKLKEISDMEGKCRSVLRYDCVIEQVQQKKGVFEKICSLLDFIGDSEISLGCVVDDEGRKAIEPYFLAYGLLQLLYSRQVAVRDILKGLELPIPGQLAKKGALDQARHRVIGHPTSNDNAAHVIIRHTLTHSGFEYWSYREFETRRGNVVDYELILNEHFEAMRAGLSKIYEGLAKFENERRTHMRGDPLSPKLQGIRYLDQVIGAVFVEPKYEMMFEASIDSLLSTVNNFRSGLLRRFGEERTVYEVDHVIEGIAMLRDLYSQRDDPRNIKRYKIVSDGISTNIERFLELARDLDESEAEDLV